MKVPRKDPLRTKEGRTLPEPPYVTGGPPFPQRPSDDGRYGLSILDYFAAHVMAGLAARLDTETLKLSGAQDAYWIAALMVGVRNDLSIEPTPVPVAPPPEEGPPPTIMPPDDLP